MLQKMVKLGLLALFFMSTIQVQARKWETDFSKAVDAGKKSGKYVLMKFCCSDDRGDSRKMEREVFIKSDFKKFARKNLICLEIDIPKRKKLSQMLRLQNPDLKASYEVNILPTIMLLTPGGDAIGRTGYMKGGPKALIKHIEKVIADDKAK